MDKKEFEQWVEKTFRDFQNNKQTITYCGQNNTVIVYDTTAVKSAIAKCHPKDVFDYKTGVAIAYARLKGLEIPEIEEEPKFDRVGKHKSYYSVDVDGKVVKIYEAGTNFNDALFTYNNYFYTKKRAEEAADKIRLLLKLGRLHDIYCPDYKPDWDNKDEEKYYVFFDHYVNIFVACDTYVTDKLSVEYFPTREIAQKVCEILNKEAGIQSLSF